MDPEVLNYVSVIFSGLINTIILTFVGIAIGTALGAVLAFMEVMGPPSLSRVIGWVTRIIRGIPLLVILFLIFYGFPRLGIPLPPLPSAMLGIGIRSGVYQSQLFRGSMEAVGRGQLEAAFSIGLSKWGAFKHVILPQAVRLMIPGWVNEFTIVLKDTSIAYAIGVTEIFTEAVHVAQVVLDYLPPLLIVAAMYFTICYSVSHISDRLYRKFMIPGLGGSIEQGAENV